MTTTLTTPAALAAHHGWRRVLAVGAHPDDLDFGAAATLAGFRAAGLHIELCIVTDGDAGGFDSEGPEAMTARRHAEQRAAAAVVGAADIDLIAGPDGAVVARALAGYDAREARLIMGHRSNRIAALLGHPGRAALVHRDDMAT